MEKRGSLASAAAGGPRTCGPFVVRNDRDRADQPDSRLLFIPATAALRNDQSALPQPLPGPMIASITSIEAIDMIREAPAMTVRQNLGELLNEIPYRGDSV
jgi:hypothetical protein